MKNKLISSREKKNVFHGCTFKLFFSMQLICYQTIFFFGTEKWHNWVSATHTPSSLLFLCWRISSTFSCTCGIITNVFTAFQFQKSSNKFFDIFHSNLLCFEEFCFSIWNRKWIFASFFLFTSEKAIKLLSFYNRTWQPPTLRWISEETTKGN